MDMKKGSSVRFQHVFSNLYENTMFHSDLQNISTYQV